jgi:integrase
MEQSSMAKVTTRKETGKLVIDFTYRGVRCREQTALPDTPQNQKRVQAVIEKIKMAQIEGTFNYRDYFPQSALAERFDPVAMPAQSTSLEIIQVQTLDVTPIFSTFVDQWVAEHSIEWRRSHIRSLMSTLTGRLIPAFRFRTVGSILKSDILLYRASLGKEKGRGGKAGLSAKRINEIVGTLCQIIDEAADRYNFTTPTVNIKRLRVQKTDIDPFSLDDVQSILCTVRADYVNYFIVRFLTGMRTGEIHGLKWQYVDFELRILRVRETFVLGEDEYTKTDGSQRDIQMSQPVYDALKIQYAATKDLSEYVFCNANGGPLDNKNFSDRVWYPILRHLGLKARRPYQTRHTAATLWLASGEAPEWIARQMGHTSTEMLFRVYSRYVPNLTRQDGSAMERLLASKLSTGIAI